MGRQAGFHQQSDQFVEPVGEQVGVADRHRGQPHDRAVAAGPLRGSPEVLASPVFSKRLRALRVVMPMSKQRPLTEYSPFSPPGDVAAGLVVEVPADAGDAVGQGQRHAGVIGPFARGQAVGAAATVAGHLGEGARRLELDGGTEGIADGEAEEGSTLAIGSEHGHHQGLQLPYKNTPGSPSGSAALRSARHASSTRSLSLLCPPELGRHGSPG